MFLSYLLCHSTTRHRDVETYRQLATLSVMKIVQYLFQISQDAVSSFICLFFCFFFVFFHFVFGFVRLYPFCVWNRRSAVFYRILCSQTNNIETWKICIACAGILNDCWLLWNDSWRVKIHRSNRFITPFFFSFFCYLPFASLALALASLQKCIFFHF